MPQRVLEIAGLASAERLLAENYAAMTLASSDERPGTMRFECTDLGALRFDRLTLRMTVRAQVQPLGTLLFRRVRSGTVRVGSQDTERDYVAGDVCLTAQPDDPYVAFVADADMELITLDPALLGHVAQTTSADRWARVRFTDYTAVSAQANERWKMMYRHLRWHALALGSAHAEPLFAGHVARLVAAAALATFPNNAVTEPDRADRRDAHTVLVRRAIAYMESESQRDISLADIAVAAGGTIRAVQLAFRRHLDTTPTRHLRRIRLDHAREELRNQPDHDASAPEDTVSRIAARSGFPPGRPFERVYEQTFGELPAHTLNQT